jgi:endonuclease/exonuclease/phosphatase family metal-dependent hydrolase
MSAIDSVSIDVDYNDDWEQWALAETFKAAAYLTDPVCKAHEFYRRLSVVDALNPTATKIENYARKFFLFCGMVTWAAIAVVTTVPATALRYVACQIQQKPFLYFQGEGEEKKFWGKFFTLLSWNVCCVAGGYTITDGGVVPWQFRVKEIAAEVKKQNADVVCLYEIFDTLAAFQLQELLKNDYAHFYLNIGPTAVGVSSGVFVASKYAIGNPDFVPFPKEMLIGRTKNAEKGIFSFDLKSDGHSFATVIPLHLQHSEECVYPTDEEVAARAQQMELVMKKVDQIKGRAVIVTGDLNLDDDEYNASSWHHRFKKSGFGEKKTWGGDQFCAKLVEKRASPSLNLDHTMILEGSAENLETTLVEAGYNAAEYKQEALSDHLGLYSIIWV